MAEKKKVLIADDEPAILRILSIKLRISGYDVVTANSGSEALDLIDSVHPDIMLLDVIMPGVDGFEVLKNLRTVSNLPVIVFSARSENAQKALNLGANIFLSKPLNLDDLIKRIETLFSNK
jgi:DNA-binding response OmpR family regulator